MAKKFEQYCPVAHALELVGERWSLLIVRELLKGPKRYTDLADALPRIGTNVLAARLKDLEACEVIVKRRLPPPTPAQVYELTPYGVALRPIVRELARWGLHSLPAPRDDENLAPGWLADALGTFFAPVAPTARSSSASATRSPRSWTGRSWRARWRSPTSCSRRALARSTTCSSNGAGTASTSRATASCSSNCSTLRRPSKIR